MQIEDRLIHYLRSLLGWRAVALNVLTAWLYNSTGEYKHMQEEITMRQVNSIMHGRF